MTDAAAPRWISRYRSELPPRVSASTDQAMAPRRSTFQCMASVSSKVRGSVTSNAAMSWITLAVRTSHGATNRFWYSVPMVMPISAAMASAMVSQCASPPDPNLRDTTITRPKNPSINPAHCRLEMRPPRDDSQKAVSTGCRPTISATRPEPMPALTALHTPPR